MAFLNIIRIFGENITEKPIIKQNGEIIVDQPCILSSLVLSIW